MRNLLILLFLSVPAWGQITDYNVPRSGVGLTVCIGPGSNTLSGPVVKYAGSCLGPFGLNITTFGYLDATTGNLLTNTTGAPSGACPIFEADTNQFQVTAVRDKRPSICGGAGGVVGLPAATALGQVPVSTGAGTAYTVLPRSGPLNFYAVDYGVTANTQVNKTVSFSSGSSTINCTTCAFVAADVGKIVWAVTTAIATAPDLPQTTITAVNSATQISVGATATNTVVSGNDYLVWGTDDSTGLTNAWNAATAVCGTLQLPAGIMLTQVPQFNTGTCSFQNFYHNVGAIGQGKQVTFIVPTPNFNFTNCAPIACFQGVAFGMYRHFAIWGGDLSPAGCNSAGLILSQNNGGFTEDQDHSSWCSGTGTAAIGFLLSGATPGSYQGGVEAYGQIGIKVTAQSGATDNFVGYGEQIGLDVANAGNSPGFMSRNSYYNGTTTAVQVENTADWNSVSDIVQCVANCTSVINVLGTGNAHLQSLRYFNGLGQAGPIVINGAGTVSAIDSNLLQANASGAVYTGSFLVSNSGGQFLPDAATVLHSTGTSVGITPTYVQNAVQNNNSSTTCAPTLTINTTPGSLILAYVVYTFTAGNTVAVTDSASDSYTQIGSELATTNTFGTLRHADLFYFNGTGSSIHSTVTFTVSGGSTPANIACFVAEVTGQIASGSPVDVNVTNTGSGTAVTPGATLTPVATSEQAWIFLAETGIPTVTYTGTPAISLLFNGLGAHFATGQTALYSSASYTATLTNSLNSDWAGNWISIKPAIASFTTNGNYNWQNTQKLTANSGAISATSAATASTQFNWSSIAPNQVRVFHCAGSYIQSVGNAAIGVAVQGAVNAPTSLTANATVGLSATTVGTGSSGAIASTTYTSVAAPTGAAFGTALPFTIDGQIQTGSSPSALNIGFYTGNASDTISIQANSYCTLQQQAF